MKFVIYSLLLSIAVLRSSCLQTEIFYKIRQLVHEHQQSLQARHNFIEQQTIEQPLDHFEPSQKTFKQRYWVNDNYWNWRKKDGPVFLYIGGEFEMSAGYIDGGRYKFVNNSVPLICLLSAVAAVRCAGTVKMFTTSSFGSKERILATVASCTFFLGVISVFCICSHNVLGNLSITRPFAKVNIKIHDLCKLTTNTLSELNVHILKIR